MTKVERRNSSLGPAKLSSVFMPPSPSFTSRQSDGLPFFLSVPPCPPLPYATSKRLSAEDLSLTMTHHYLHPLHQCLDFLCSMCQKICGDLIWAYLFISLITQSQSGPERDEDQDSMLYSFCILPLQPHLPTRHSVNSCELVQALQEILHSCHSFPKTTEPCFYLKKNHSSYLKT